MVYSLTFAWTKIHKCIKKYSDKKKSIKILKLCLLVYQYNIIGCQEKKKIKKKKQQQNISVKVL